MQLLTDSCRVWFTAHYIRHASSQTVEHNPVPPTGSLDKILDHFQVKGEPNDCGNFPLDEVLFARVFAGRATASDLNIFRERLCHSAKWREAVEDYLREEAAFVDVLAESRTTNIQDAVLKQREELLIAIEHEISFDPFWDMLDLTERQTQPGGPPFNPLEFLQAYGERPCSLSPEQMLLIATLVNRFEVWRENFDTLRNSEDQAILECQIAIEDRQEFMRQLRNKLAHDAKLQDQQENL